MNILYKTKSVPEKLEEKIIADSKKDFTPITSYTLVNGIIDNYFYKKINMPKVMERYDGNYVKLLIEYYRLLSKIIRCNDLIEIIENDGDIYEVSVALDSNHILHNNKDISFEEMKRLLILVLDEINKLEFSNVRGLGIDSAIWNYTSNGVFFDYDPPKIFSENSLFIPKNDDDYRKRVIYRNFNYNGMRANTLGTVFLGNHNWNFNIVNLPNNYAESYVDIFLSSLPSKNDREIFKQSIFGESDCYEFDKHPINIIRKELRK